MDFWSRLVGSATSSNKTQQITVHDPQQRLTRFTRVHDQLLQIWQKNHRLSPGSNATQKSLVYLNTLKQTLQDEIQSSSPHQCIAYAASAQVYKAVTAVALSSSDERHIHEALDVLNLLLDSEEGEFLEEDAFADIVVNLVSKISSSGSILVSAQTEGVIVELLFGIASKLRLQPEALPAWFRPRIHGSADIPEKDYSSSPYSGQKEFPIFYFLLNYVHHDGRAGDFARTGLLYLIETAAHNEELEKWIVESDLATLMASGLGALYSRLSSMLVLSFSEDSIPAIVAFSEVSRVRPASGVDETGSPEFQVLLGTFLSYLMFWQDVLEYCASNDIKQSLLDHFQFLFLQQLLYPSLLESSDIDGGSSVAVLTYLRCILESITHPELVRLIFQYLLALPETQSEDMSITRPTTLARRRKSQTLLTTLAKGEEKPSPNLFNLVDLILTSLRSRNQQTVTATLRLCSTIIRSQHLHAVSTLIKVQANPFLITHRTIGAHNVEVETFLSIAEELAGGDDLELSYEAHLQDTLNLLETHCCSAKILALPGDDAKMKHKNTSSHGFPMSTSVSSHKILPDDPLLECLLSLLDTFLVNDIDTNLSLTQTFTNLASCGFTSLEDWLLRNHSNDDYPSEHEVSEDDYNEEDLLYDYQNASRIDGFAIMNASKQARLEPIRSPESSSPFLAALDSLVRQVEKFREQIQDFDIYLTERKHIFKVGEEIDSALADTPTPLTKSEDSKNTSTLTLQSPSHFSSISQRLLHETTSSNASRASSPRGRQNSGSAAPTLAGRLGRLRISSSPGPSKPIGRTYSASPFRNSSISSTPPKNATPMGPSDALHQKLKLSTGFAASRYHTNDTEGSETSSMHSEPVGPQGRKGEETREISLSHLLTNVIILQEFVLEVAALVEVRASLFGDVKFI